MPRPILRGLLIAVSALCLPIQPSHADPGNPAIDAQQHVRVTLQALEQREVRRIDEEEFLRMAGEPDTVVLDARSADMFHAMHIRGAVNLPFTDMTQAALAALLPNKATRILIYCNNNFINAERAFPSKLPSSSLNLSTYAALYDYGYRNVYELAPLLDATTTALPLAGSLVESLPKQEWAQSQAPLQR